MVQRDDDAILSWMLRRVVEPAEYMRRLAAIDGVPQMQASDTVTLIWTKQDQTISFTSTAPATAAVGGRRKSVV